MTNFKVFIKILGYGLAIGIIVGIVAAASVAAYQYGSIIDIVAPQSQVLLPEHATSTATTTPATPCTNCPLIKAK